MRVHLAVDIGASGGRHIAGWLEDGKIQTREVYRFENGFLTRGEHLVWDHEKLFREVVNGMIRCREEGLIPETMGIDTWGVDYILLDGKGQPVGAMMAYRDSRTQGMDGVLEQKLPYADFYAVTGIAKQPFNTIYQMMADLKEHPEYAESAEDFLMVPEYLCWRLTGEKAHEYSELSTGALLDAGTKTWAKGAIAAAGLPEKWFRTPILFPGAALGTLKEEIRAEVGYDTRVVMTATHDTGSAFVAVPAEDSHAAFLSSGTWSLLGTELEAPCLRKEALEAGFTNEGGAAGTIRFLKNIMGMWMLQCLRHEDGDRHSYAEMADMAARSAYGAWIDAADERFMAPGSMTEEVKKALLEKGAPAPENLGDLCRAVTVGLAVCYRDSIRSLEEITGNRITSVNIVGGGSQNRTLNRLTAQMTGLKVFTGPVEGTALGNLGIQMMAAGEVRDVADFRHILRRSFVIEEYGKE